MEGKGSSSAQAPPLLPERWLSWSFAVKSAATAAVFAVFFYQVSYIFEDFALQSTNIGIDYVLHERLNLPRVTMCNARPYKAPMDNAADEEEFLNKTWSYEEMFPDSNFKIWNVTEIRSYLMGRCYSFSTNVMFPSVSLDQFIQRRSNIGMNIYVHFDQEDDFWLWYLLTPTGIATNFVPMNTNLDLHLLKSSVTIMERGDNCRPYQSNVEFMGCATKLVNKKALESCTFTPA